MEEQQAFNLTVWGSIPSRRTSMLRVAQLARAPDCGSGGQRFKPAHAPHGTLAQLVERQTEDLRVSGLIPVGPTIIPFLLTVGEFLCQQFLVQLRITLVYVFIVDYGD